MEGWRVDLEDNVQNFLKNRPCAEVEHTKSFFNLEDFEVDCSISNITISEELSSISISPNPAQNQLSIYNNNGAEIWCKITIFTLEGRQASASIHRSLSTSATTIDTSTLHPGLYVLRITKSDNSKNLLFAKVE